MPDTISFDPFDPDQAHAITTLARRLHREAPVLRLPGGFVLVSRYEDVRQVLRSNANFVNAGGFRPSGLHVPLEDRTLGELDPPEHGPIRKLAMGAVSNPGAIEALRGFTREACDALFARLLAKGGGDLIAEFSVPLTNRVIARTLGVPLGDSDWLAEQAEQIMTSDMPTSNRTPRGFGYAAAFPEFTAFIDHLIAARREQGWQGDDAISRIVETAGGVTVAPPETIIRMLLIQLLLGGGATTRDFLGSLFIELIRNPDLNHRVAANPALVPVAAEEGLRLAPPVLFLIRTCRKATTLSGITIEPGERVVAATAAANRDGAVYDDPDSFQVDRVNPQPHLTFGFGSHFCAGAALARMEIETALESFLRHVEPGRLRTPPGFEVTFMPTPFLLGPASLPVTLADT